MGRLRKFWGLPSTDRRALGEAALFLCASRLAVWMFPFRWIAPHLGQCMARTPEEEEPENREVVRLVAWAVNTANRRLPWDYKCLAQAISAKIMLRRRGVAATLYLGLSKREVKKLQAHAWLRSGNTILTGNTELDRYTVVSTFA